MNIRESVNITKGKKIPSWETRLWFYLSKGSGVRCPMLNECRSLKIYGECPDMHRKQIKSLVDKVEVDLHNFDFITNSIKLDINCELFRLIERLSWKYIRLGGIKSPPVPESLIYFIDIRHPIDIREVKLKHLYSAIWYLNDRWVIQLKNNNSSQIKRYSLFHEGFHILAHDKSMPMLKKIGSENRSFNELLAGYFAGSILIPKPWLVNNWAAMGNLEDMAQLFDVTPHSMYIRLRQFGLI